MTKVKHLMPNGNAIKESEQKEETQPVTYVELNTDQEKLSFSKHCTIMTLCTNVINAELQTKSIEKLVAYTQARLDGEARKQEYVINLAVSKEAQDNILKALEDPSKHIQFLNNSKAQILNAMSELNNNYVLNHLMNCMDRIATSIQITSNLYKLDMKEDLAKKEESILINAKLAVENLLDYFLGLPELELMDKNLLDQAKLAGVELDLPEKISLVTKDVVKKMKEGFNADIFALVN